MKKQPSPTPTLSILPNGIEKIALSFSGGGFRAAAFSLGCVHYLSRLHYKGEPLLHKVKFISSASGGSITNMVLCAMLREGVRFDEIYDHLKTQMKGTGLLKSVFDVLANPAAWADRQEKTKNLINAFAIVYDRDLFRGATFKALHQTPVKNGYVVADTCVNTTEFDNGMNFRWETSGKLGNNYLYFDPRRQAADKIKLGDILASSSCFPGGFEPIMFPNDFTWSGTNEALTKAELARDINEINVYNDKETEASKINNDIAFGFMDGGIDDNQGIYAFELADQRKEGHYDLYFPCDVSSNFIDDPFAYPAAPTAPLLQQTPAQLIAKAKTYRNWYIALCTIALLSGTGAIFAPSIRAEGLILTGIAFTAITWPLIAYYFLKKTANSLANSVFPSANSSGSWSVVFNAYKNRFLDIPLSSLIAMLLARAQSVLLLAMDVYLKRIRQISYKLLYADKANDVYKDLIEKNNASPGLIDTGSLWQEHIGVTTVYQLSTRNDFMLSQILKRSKLGDQTLSPEDAGKIADVLYPISATLRQLADAAADVPTTLWFDPEQESQKAMEKLIAAGEATMCFNLTLMAYQFGNTEDDWTALKQSLVADWKTFQQDPCFMSGTGQ